MKLHVVMVPLDGSPLAEAALPLGASVARQAGAGLRLVMVHSAPMVGGDGMAALLVALQEQAHAYLRSAASRVDPGGSLPTEVEVLQGPAGATLAAAAEASRADLVVMATHGRGPVNRMWLGSVADYLLRHLHVPMLVVRPPEEGAPAGPVALQRVLVPLDPSTTSELVFDPVFAVCRAGVEITLLHVVEPVIGAAEPALPAPLPMDPALLGDLRRLAQERLDRVAERLRERGAQVRTRLLTGLGPAAQILEEAGRGAYDLIAMTTQGQGGLRRFLLGSVADKVIRGAACPVLLQRPGAPL